MKVDAPMNECFLSFRYIKIDIFDLIGTLLSFTPPPHTHVTPWGHE